MRRGNMSRGMRSAGVLEVSVVTIILAGATGASSAEAPEPVAQQKGAASEGGVGEFTTTGSQLKEAQGQLDVADARARELEAQRQKLRKDPGGQPEAAKDSQAR